MAYIRLALGKGSAGLYAALALLSAFCMGNLAQANSLCAALAEEIGSFGAPGFGAGWRLALGLGLALLTWRILRGGAGAVGRAAERLVPVRSLGTADLQVSAAQSAGADLERGAAAPGHDRGGSLGPAAGRILQ